MNSGQVNQDGSQPSGNTPVDMSTPITTMVDGKQVTLTIQDLANGYAAGSKMTQATQEAAELRKELAQWEQFRTSYETDPETMIARLAEQAGIAPPQAPAGDNLNEDPVSAEVAQMKKLIAQQKREFENLQTQLAAQAQGQQLSSEIADLKGRFGDAFNLDEVQAYATSKGIDSLETAFHASRGEAQAAGKPVPTIGQTAATLRSVSPGGPVNSGSPLPNRPEVKSLADAMLLAAEDNGLPELTMQDLLPS